LDAVRKLTAFLPALLAFGVIAAPASAVTVIGPANPNPAPGPSPPAHDLDYHSPSLLFQAAAPFGLRNAAPADGVVVRWLFYSDDVIAGATAQLRIVSPATLGAFTVMRSGDVEPLDPVTTTPGTIRTVQHSFAARLPIKVGETPGLGFTAPAADYVLPTSYNGQTGWTLAMFQSNTTPPPADGGTATPNTVANEMLSFNAEVEPDSDADGFGDESQDRCAGEAGPDRGCPAGRLAPQTVIQVNTVQLEPVSALASIVASGVALATNHRTLNVPVSCPVQQAGTCRARLTARTSKTVAITTATHRTKRRILGLGSASFKIAQGRTSTVKLSVPTATRNAIKGLKHLGVTVSLLTTSTVKRP
jgi:hypothetical protein